jgi:hypothetical protein
MQVTRRDLFQAGSGAVAAAREGCRVVLVERSRWLRTRADRREAAAGSSSLNTRPRIGGCLETPGTRGGATKKAALADASAAFVRFRQSANQPTIILAEGSFGLQPGKFETVTR